VNFAFLDSAFVIALEFAHDQNHLVARKCWASFAAQGRCVATTFFVLNEVVTHLNSRRSHDRAVRLGEELMKSSQGTFIEVDHELFVAGWDYFVRHADKEYSLTDCISFVVMQQRGLRQALTFDQHFAQAGFECVPPLVGAT
jgi:uncharacterized protein